MDCGQLRKISVLLTGFTVPAVYRTREYSNGAMTAILEVTYP
ncbi:MAG TPA: hypothetical protein VHT26_15755 [Trebonia sp.]|jgi:hypothetical protein|nr:hypothetical protein [Trebonia sp.]